MSKNARHVLSKAQIDALPGVDKRHFLNREARRLNKTLGDPTGLTGLGVHWIEVQPGVVSAEQHFHHQEDEAVYVISGRGFVRLDDERFDVGPGDFVGLPAGGPAHEFACEGEEPLRLLVIGQRLPVDTVDYPRVQKRMYRRDETLDLVDFSAIVDPRQANPDIGSK